MAMGKRQFSAYRQRQHDNVKELPRQLRKSTENVKALVSKWSSHNKYSHNTIINIFCREKRGHVVAAVLSRAQLCQKLCWFSL